jgi:hypothetical protein
VLLEIVPIDIPGKRQRSLYVKKSCGRTGQKRVDEYRSVRRKPVMPTFNDQKMKSFSLIPIDENL